MLGSCDPQEASACFECGKHVCMQGEAAVAPEDVGRKAAHMLLEELDRGGVSDGSHQVRRSLPASAALSAMQCSGQPHLVSAVNNCVLVIAVSNCISLACSGFLPAYDDAIYQVRTFRIILMTVSSEHQPCCL